MSNVCPSCGAAQSQAWLCSDCCSAVETMLAAVPQLIDQLDIAIAKQSRVSKGNYAGNPIRPASADDELGSSSLKHERLPINWGVVAVRDALMVEAAFVGQDINWLRSHVQAAEMVRDLGKAVKNSYRAIDRARDRECLGLCGMYDQGREDYRCQAELWAKPKAKEVKCGACEHIHAVSDRRLELMELARDMIFTTREAALYVADVGGMPVGNQRIRNYLDRNRIAERPSPDGVKRLRLGDLLDVLQYDAARHEARAG